MTAKKILWLLLLVVTVSTGVVSCSSDDNGNGGITPPEIDETLNRQTTGSSARDLLSDEKYSRIVLEILYVQGYEPNAASVENLKDFLGERMHKPDGIDVEMTAIESPGDTVYSVERVAEIERELRANYNYEDEIAVFVFFADQKSDQDEGNKVVLGAAYWNTSFVIYESTIQDIAARTGTPSRTVLESTVMQHEFGHLLGLVNFGTDLTSDHQDEDHGHHCDVEDCLMYYLAESGGDLSNVISGGSIPELDPLCIADLQANGGK
ncbi:membrane metalloprotease [Sinomicrobium weinanense]|uniref:Membrane metalloprotease n=1 Tax=Sinomicrobium weinanense TaxID=2842200 RepID=A0A926JT99_9FLAO|nr:membrane metalloprotease [Sinomicrobium weinanense]MBC9796842.1 membrane metalloprotease [Sinomicrobium weinanense]MBU3125215.1 membrane metalloprotease [Sinomicrobium weinanense]